MLFRYPRVGTDLKHGQDESICLLNTFRSLAAWMMVPCLQLSLYNFFRGFSSFNLSFQVTARLLLEMRLERKVFLVPLCLSEYVGG